MNIEEQKHLTPAEITNNPELFQRNEYLRLTGQWFTSLPCHFWNLKKGMEIEIQYAEDVDYLKKMAITFDEYLTMNTFSAFYTTKKILYFINFNCIKKMRIISFEVKND